MQSRGSNRLTMRQGPTPGKVFELVKDVVTIGRDVSNDITINDAEVSRNHARLTAQSGGYLIEDLASTNGTFVNGQRLIGPKLLNGGDVVGLGETVVLEYGFVADAGATVVAAGPMRAEPDYPTTPPRAEEPQTPTYEPEPAYQPEPAYEPEPAYQQAPDYDAPPTMAEPIYAEAVQPTPPPPPPPTAAPARRSNTARNVGIGCGCLTLCACLAVATWAALGPIQDLLFQMGF
jgi:predicted component of type VI protein secretion system